ncbi:GDSL-like protein [Cutibacterium modestum 28N]|nr:GDSL-like protein [Cutibacterium modestum P08]MCP2376959.1 GDSL-like protein [Cutibacterium modestum 28N]
MKRILRILSVMVAVVVVAGIAIGLRPNSHAFGSVFQGRHISDAASVSNLAVGTIASSAVSSAVTSAPTPAAYATRKVTGHGGTLATLGLGDSVPQGGPCTNCTTFIERVGTDMARKAGVKAAVRNESVAGYKTADVLTQLESNSTKSLLETSDLVIVTIGANDFDLDTLVGQCAHSDVSCVADDVNDVTGRVRTILERVKAGMSTPGATVVVTGYWNVGFDGKAGRNKGPATSRWPIWSLRHSTPTSRRSPTRLEWYTSTSVLRLRGQMVTVMTQHCLWTTGITRPRKGIRCWPRLWRPSCPDEGSEPVG